jgi:hypothetical protein
VAVATPGVANPGATNMHGRAQFRQNHRRRAESVRGSNTHWREPLWNGVEPWRVSHLPARSHLLSAERIGMWPNLVSAGTNLARIPLDSIAAIVMALVDARWRCGIGDARLIGGTMAGSIPRWCSSRAVDGA